ncbi:MAG: BMP family ABC transporter substrate-binding protein [Candidatus Chlorobium antarcticum]|nr:BMP family ABC transporter substrate-binding protein [Candidatus Chlorobium antarcticum]
MKHLLIILFSALTFLAGCSPVGDEEPLPSDSLSSSPLTVGLVFDAGGRGDRSFNDSAYHGLELARSKRGIDFVYAEPDGQGSDREAALRLMAVNPDVQLVIGVGLLFSEDIARMAMEFPDKKFACVDYLQTPGVTIPSNLAGMVFENKKGSFLAGAIAGLVTRTQTVGFIGGMESSLIRQFQTGFTEGVRFVNPEVTVIPGYIGMTGSAFANPAKGRELALGQYGRGVDIIYQAAGASGLGVIEAARESGKLVICTDRDQEYLAPGFVLTTITKAVDQAVLAIVESVLDGSFAGGTAISYGLADRYTDYVYNEKNSSLISSAVHKRVEQIRADILAGKIVFDETTSLN